jgi:hypothetical protein
MREGPLWNDAAAIQAEIDRLAILPVTFQRQNRIDHMKVRLAYVPVLARRHLEENLKAAIKTKPIYVPFGGIGRLKNSCRKPLTACDTAG